MPSSCAEFKYRPILGAQGPESSPAETDNGLLTFSPELIQASRLSVAKFRKALPHPQ